MKHRPFAHRVDMSTFAERVLSLWRHKIDTVDIARRLGIHEAEVYRIIISRPVPVRAALPCDVEG